MTPTAAAAMSAGPPVLNPERLIPPPLAEFDRFGAAVAACGDLVAIGAPRDGDDGAMAGSAWIHRLVASPGAAVMPILLDRLASGVDGDRFGGAVALAPPCDGWIDGALLAVGADWTDVGDVAFAGAVHLYGPTEPTAPSSDSPSDAWSRRQILVDVVPEAGAEFGRAIAIGCGALAPIAVAAPRADLIDAPDAGSVTLFLRGASGGDLPTIDRAPGPIAVPIDVALSMLPFLAGSAPPPLERRHAEAGPWLPVAILTAPDPSTSGWFGYSVAMDGDDLVIGEPGAGALGDDGAPVPGAGAVHVYRLEGGIPRRRATLRAPVAEHAAWFGMAVDLRNGSLAIGAPRARDGGVPTGAVYLYDVDDLDHPSRPPRVIRAPLAQPGPQSGLGFGVSIALRPDALGANLLAIGASGFDLPTASAPIEDAGAVWLVDPSDAGTTGPRWLARLASDPIRPSSCLGHAVALACVGFGAPGANPTYVASGHLYLEEESRAPSPGVALHRVPEPSVEPSIEPSIEPGGPPPPELSPATDTTARRSGASPRSTRSR